MYASEWWVKSFSCLLARSHIHVLALRGPLLDEAEELTWAPWTADLGQKCKERQESLDARIREMCPGWVRACVADALSDVSSIFLPVTREFCLADFYTFTTSSTYFLNRPSTLYGFN